MDGGRVLVAIDVGIDTSTPEGRLATEALAGVGSIERERISAGTRHGMAAARARGQRQGPIAVADVPELHARIARMREDGMTLQAIADVLNDEGVPTLRGGAKWRPSSVQRAAGYRRPVSYGGLSLPHSARVNATNFGPCTHGVRSGNAGWPCQRTDLAPTMHDEATSG